MPEAPKSLKQVFSTEVDSDVAERFLDHKQCIWEVKTQFYHHWLLIYQISRGVYITVVLVDSHIGGYHKIVSLRGTRLFYRIAIKMADYPAQALHFLRF